MFLICQESHVRIVDPDGNVVCKGGRALVNQHLSMPAIPFSASAGEIVLEGSSLPRNLRGMEDHFRFGA